MIRNRKVLWISTAAFVAVEILMGILLQTVGGRGKAELSFLSIIVACAFCFVFIEKSAPYVFTQVALIFTVCADYFLVWCDPQVKLTAMVFFSAVQLAYFGRLWVEDENRRHRIWHVSVRAGLSVLAVVLTLCVLGASADPLAVVSMFYYANLITNAVFAFLSGKKNLLVGVGLILFILCDTVIGLSMLGGYITMAPDSFIYKLIHPGFDLAWAFYLPSQTVLAVSLLPKRIKDLSH